MKGGTCRYGREVVGGVVLDALGVVDERREDDDADDEEEDEQHQLVRGRLERVDEDLEAGRVARQLHTRASRRVIVTRHCCEENDQRNEP